MQLNLLVVSSLVILHLLYVFLSKNRWPLNWLILWFPGNSSDLSKNFSGGIQPLSFLASLLSADSPLSFVFCFRKDSVSPSWRRDWNKLSWSETKNHISLIDMNSMSDLSGMWVGWLWSDDTLSAFCFSYAAQVTFIYSAGISYYYDWHIYP